MKQICNKELYLALKSSDLTEQQKYFGCKFHMQVRYTNTIEDCQINNELGFTHLNIKRWISNNCSLEEGKFYKVLDWLKENNWIEVNNSYQVGISTKSYRATWNKGDDYITYPNLLNKVGMKSYNAILKKESRIDQSEFTKMQLDNFNLLSLDLNKVNQVFQENLNLSFNEAKQHLDDKRVFKYYFSVINWQQKNWFYHISINTGRVFTNITNLPKEIRKCLINDNGQQIWEIDIRNSQPSLLLSMILDQNLAIEDKVSIAIETGKFYELLNKDWKLTERSEIKRKFYSNILFCAKIVNEKNLPKFKYKKFGSSIIKLKEDKKQTLATKLQSKESKLIFKFIKEYKINCCTIHDCLMLFGSESKINKIRKDFKDFLIKELNIKIKISKETY